MFVHFDWRAADIRIAAILSGDKHLGDISLNDDPYNYVAKLLDVERDEAKLALLSTINAMRPDDKILDLFPQVRSWIRDCLQKLALTRSLNSLLGRKFSLQDDRTEKSVFNAIMQGSIAHAMQVSIAKIWQTTDFRLLAEVHDSAILICQKGMLPSVINTVTGIMCRPFSGILESNPVFPVRVSVGLKWRQWKPRRLYTDVGKYKAIN